LFALLLAAVDGMLSLRDAVVGKMSDFEDIVLPLLRAQKYKKNGNDS
jgi:hypothetical protein